MSATQTDFQQAIALAQAGDTQTAHAMIGQLRAAHDTVEMALWYAFTAPTFAEARTGVDDAARLNPHSPLLDDAKKWLLEWHNKELAHTKTRLLTTLPPDLQEGVAEQIQAHEQLVWVGRPGVLAAFMRQLPFMALVVPAAFATSSFLTFLRLGSAALEGNLGYVLTRLLVIAGPLILLSIGAMFWEARRMARSVYALTNRRLLIIRQQWFEQSVKEYSHCTPGRFEIRERDDGSGNLFMGEEMEGTGKMAGLTKIVLIGIPDVRKVAQTITDTLPHGHW